FGRSLSAWTMELYRSRWHWKQRFKRRRWQLSSAGCLRQTSMDFAGLRVLSLESRRAELMEQIIRRHGGDPFVAPSVKEIPFEQHDEVFRWAERLFAGDFDMVVLMTGVGLSYLRDILAGRYSQDVFAEALRR